MDALSDELEAMKDTHKVGCIENSLRLFLDKQFVPFLVRTPVKISLSIASLRFLIVCIVLALHMDQGYDLHDFFPVDSQLHWMFKVFLWTTV